MAYHLSVKLSPFENLSLVAQGITMTQKYADVQERLLEHELPKKITMLKMTALALAAIGLVIAVLVNRTAGIILSCLCVVPLIGIHSQHQNEKIFLARFDAVSNEARIIFRLMTVYLNEERAFKESVLTCLFNSAETRRFSHQGYADQKLQEITLVFDTGNILFKDEAEAQRYQFRSKIATCAQSVLSMTAPPTIPNDHWKEFYLSCYWYLYGRGNSPERVGKVSYVPLWSYPNDEWKATTYPKNS